jgi:hypothetical protein
MLKEGEPGGRAGGGICWEARLEVVREVRRGDEAKLLRSGAIVHAEGGSEEAGLKGRSPGSQ